MSKGNKNYCYVLCAVVTFTLDILHYVRVYYLEMCDYWLKIMCDASLLKNGRYRFYLCMVPLLRHFQYKIRDVEKWYNNASNYFFVKTVGNFHLVCVHFTRVIKNGNQIRYGLVVLTHTKQ